MNQPPDEAMKEATKVFQAMRDNTLDFLGKTTMEFANTDAYAQAMGMMLDQYLTATIPIKRYTERYAADTLSALNIPTRQEVTGLAERLTHIEMRLDDMDIQMNTLLKSVQQLVTNTRVIREGMNVQKQELAHAVETVEAVEAALEEEHANEDKDRKPAGKNANKPGKGDGGK